ncbi:unnamed protein product, partial [Brenthis ino]
MLRFRMQLMDLKNRESAPMIQMFLEKMVMLAPSTMIDRPLPDVPSNKTEGPVNDAPSTMIKDLFNGTSTTMTDWAFNDSPATAITTDPFLLEITSVIVKYAVVESSTQSVIIVEIETKRSTTPFPDSNILEERSADSLGENHPAPAASLTSFQIRSIPTMAAPKTGRKHQRQESEMLTSTPVKAEQALKFKKANIKKTKISELEGSRKTKTKRSSV